MSSSAVSVISVKPESVKEGDLVVVEQPIFTDHEFKQPEPAFQPEDEDEESQEAEMS
jgi:hypothetical protein